MTLSVTVIIASFILLFCGSTVVYGDDDSQYYEVKSSDPKEGVYKTTPIFQNGAAKLLKCGVDQVFDKVETIDFTLNGKKHSEILGGVSSIAEKEQAKFIETRCKGFNKCNINLSQVNVAFELSVKDTEMTIKYKCRRLTAKELEKAKYEPQIGYWKFTRNSKYYLQCDAGYVFNKVKSVTFSKWIVQSQYGDSNLASFLPIPRETCSGNEEAQYINERCKGIHSCNINTLSLSHESVCSIKDKNLSFYYQCRPRTASDPAVTVTSNPMNIKKADVYWKINLRSEGLLYLGCPLGEIFDDVKFSSLGRATIPKNVRTPSYAKNWKKKYPLQSSKCHGMGESKNIRDQCKNSTQCVIDLKKMYLGQNLKSCSKQTYLVVQYTCKEQDELKSAIKVFKERAQ